jgi:hypothetical protein
MVAGTKPVGSVATGTADVSGKARASVRLIYGMAER